jgi:transposase-like protein
MAPDDDSPLSRPFTGWRKQGDPDPAAVAELYRSGLTQKEIARRLGVSRQRVAEALAAAGVERRESGRTCPVGAAELRRLVAEGKKQDELSAMFAASRGTVGRWLAEAGIGKPDPRMDHGRLRELYVVEALTVREVAERFGVPRQRVIRELALAGIPRRSRHERRPRGARAAVTEEALRELYVERRLTIRELCAAFGVSDEYVRKRLRQCQLAKRPGTFVPKLERDRAEVTADAAELYEAGHGLREVSEALGISTNEVRQLLHEAGVSVRPPGLPSTADQRHRRLLEDLYGDSQVVDVLERFDVPVQDPSQWTRPSPFETLVDLPVPETLVRELYVEVGLSGYHISLLCGVGALSVMNRLRALGIAIRPSGRPCPWTTRTYG